MAKKSIKRGVQNPPLKPQKKDDAKKRPDKTKDSKIAKATNEPKTIAKSKIVKLTETNKQSKNNNANRGQKGTSKSGKITKRVSKSSKVITAPKIVYNQSEINKLRATVRNPNGTFLKREEYEEILERARNEKESIDEIKIEIMRENPNIRLIEETTNQTLHFQTGNFIDRLKDDGNEIKTRANFSVTDFKGDEIETQSKTKLTEALRDANNIINDVINHIKENTKAPKGKQVSIYVTIPEVIKSTSDGKIISISYDFNNLEVQGIDKKTFDFYLRDYLD